jgi:DNA-directed RNA polymerase beta subunit
VDKGDILTEGYATEKGELALGRNLACSLYAMEGLQL